MQSSESSTHTDKLLATAATYLQSENYRLEFAPASLNPPAPLTREQFAAHLGHLRNIMSSFPVRAKKSWANPSLNQVVVWADGETVFHAHVRDNEDEEEWKYVGEYMFVISMDESGEKIDHVLEFVDSKGTERLRGLMARARKVLGDDHGVLFK
ncbi:hypothetical protein B0H13DRAFT_2653171 [Mycena leptocephala]|nr:hypothetical protein B0H13DRAFT_2653171 [Mycena leptocephala]